MKGACRVRGLGGSDHRPQGSITILANQAWEEISKYWQSRITEYEDLPCALQASNLLHFSVSATSAMSFHSCCTKLRVKSSGIVEGVSVVNCRHVLMGLCVVVLRYALKLQVWNVYPSLRDMRLCQRFSSCGPQVAVRDGLSLGVAGKFKKTLCFRVKHPKNNFSCSATRL